jgi:acyl carrier protein
MLMTDLPRGAYLMNKVPAQSILADAFKNFFKINEIDNDTNFFDFGINSIELSAICSDLALGMNMDISILLFYEFPTIRLLAEHLEDIREN